MSVTRSNRQIILDSHQTLDAVGYGNDAVELGLFASIFAALTQTLEGPARFFVLPSALIMDCVRGIIALLNLINSYNRNLNKYSKFILEIFKVGAVGTAIIGSLMGVLAIAAITPFLFIGALGLNSLYHAAKAIFYGVKWASAKGEHGRQHHKKEFMSNIVSTVTGIIAVVAITLLLAVKPELGIFKSIVAYGTSVVLGVSALFSGLQAYRANKASEIESDKKIPAASASIAPDNQLEHTFTIHHLEQKHKPQLSNRDILNLHPDDLIHHVLALPRPKAKILELLEEKIGILDNAIDSLSFFQTNKRNLKAEFLKHLYSILGGEEAFSVHENTRIASPSELIAFMEKHHKLHDVFGSLFSEVGEVQKLFLLGDAYFKKFKPQVVARADNVMFASLLSERDDNKQANGFPAPRPL
jgi:hypothetical protein